MKPNSILIAGLTLAMAAVLLGAFGTHVLEDKLASWYEDAPRRLESWKTGVLYQMFHSLGMIAIGGIALIRPRWRSISACSMFLGMVLFSGCLYGWVLTAQTWMVMIVPIGGLAMIFGWLAAIIGLLQGPESSTVQE